MKKKKIFFFAERIVLFISDLLTIKRIMWKMYRFLHSFILFCSFLQLQHKNNGFLYRMFLEHGLILCLNCAIFQIMIKQLNEYLFECEDESVMQYLRNITQSSAH